MSGSARRWWRPGRSDDQRAEERDGPVRLGEVLPDLMRRLNRPDPDVITATFTHWERVVGPEIARQCQPIAIEDDKLVVSARDPMWADELRWNESAVLSRLAEEAGGRRLKGLIMRVEPHRPRPGAGLDSVEGPGGFGFHKI